MELVVVCHLINMAPAGAYTSLEKAIDAGRAALGDMFFVTRWTADGPASRRTLFDTVYIKRYQPDDILEPDVQESDSVQEDSVPDVPDVREHACEGATAQTA